MPTINQLPTLETVSAADQLPVYSAENGDARKSSLNTLATWLKALAGTWAFTNVNLAGAFAASSVQSLSGPGAISTEYLLTKFLSTATGNALTLADAAEGTFKVIVYTAETAGGDTGILTPTNLGAGTTITFNAVGDACVLVFTASNWWAVSLRGAVLA
jgi:hypothetical protein